MGRDMKKKKSQLVVEFSTPQDLEDFLTAHQYLAQAAVRQGQTFTSASRFGAICIVKEVNQLAAKLNAALQKAKSQNDLTDTADIADTMPNEYAQSDELTQGDQ